MLLKLFSVGICLILILVGATGVLSFNDVIEDQSGIGNQAVKDDVIKFADLMRKRGTIIDGLRAAAKLLKGAEEVKKGPRKGAVFRDFRKHGNFDKAVRDLFTSNPENIRKFKMADGIKGLFGEKGDVISFLSIKDSVASLRLK